jgi:hypothetical protein
MLSQWDQDQGSDFGGLSNGKFAQFVVRSS